MTQLKLLVIAKIRNAVAAVAFPPTGLPVTVALSCVVAGCALARRSTRSTRMTKPLPPYANPELRRKSIGSSDIGIILGVSQFMSPVQLYLQKRGELPPVQETEAMAWGTLLEHDVCARYQHITGNKVARVNKTQRLKGYDWATSHIDRRVVGQSKILEAKCVGQYSGKGFGDAGTDDLPEHILAQVQWQMGVNEMDLCDVAALFGAQWAMRIFPVERDKELFATMLERAIEFWARVQEGRPPEPESEADCKALWSKSRSTTIVASARVAIIARAHREATRETNAEEDARKFQVLRAMGDADTLADMDGNILATNKNTPGAYLDQKGLKADHPELHAKYMRKTNSRKLLIKETKDE